jgi:hypothetical protein
MTALMELPKWSIGVLDENEQDLPIVQSDFHDWHFSADLAVTNGCLLTGAKAGSM